MKIFFDLDYTLFDTGKLKARLQQALAKEGVDEALFVKTYKDSKNNLFYEPKLQLELIEKLVPAVSAKKTEQILQEILDESSNFLYQDAVPFLQKWHKKLNLNLLTFGNEDFQREKVKRAGIESFFNEIFVVQDVKKAEILKRLLDNREKILLVDDNPADLAEAKESFPELVTAIRIKREKAKYSDIPDSPGFDFSIQSLKELEEIIFSLADCLLDM